MFELRCSEFELFCSESAGQVLARLSPQFEAMYARVGRPSVAPEKLLRARGQHPASIIAKQMYTSRVGNLSSASSQTSESMNCQHALVGQAGTLLGHCRCSRAVYAEGVMKPYPIQLEISGPIALWARPDTMPNPVSYVAPTCSAVKGIFETVLRWKSVNVQPTKCEICAPVQFHRYAFNYGGPLRKSDQVKTGSSLQVFAQVLVNVCYRLYAQVAWGRGPNGEMAEAPDGACAPHAYLDAFNRRLERGRWFYTPCLGWKEFVPDYVGPFREGTARCVTENHAIPAFLEMVFDQPRDGLRGRESYLRNVQIKEGELKYEHGESNYA